jgi:blue copper oxidase
LQVPGPVWRCHFWVVGPGRRQGGGPCRSLLWSKPEPTSFLDGAETPSWGFGQAYLGPTLRMRRGVASRMKVTNALEFPITCHWHGLHVDAILDGGPQLSIAPGESWTPELPIDQPAATTWYHSHSHGVTAEQVYGGLAGLILIDDPEAGDSSLPSTYGIDDIPLVIQDRAFTEAGGFSYIKRGPALMHGFRADQIVVNGAIRPEAAVPAGLTRLRLLNGSNARLYTLVFEDGRPFHQVASDGGLLPAPLRLNRLSLAPGERAEIVADFSDGKPVRLLSGPDTNDPMGGMGMMGGMMGGMLTPPPQAENAPDGFFVILTFTPDAARPAAVTALPARFESAPLPEFGMPEQERRFELSMHGGGMMGMMGGMTINGASFAMDRIDVEMRRGVTELWTIAAPEMGHPFHIHGTAFQVVRQNGTPVDYATTGLKDVVLVSGEATLLVQVNTAANAATPYMFHCHILEHEDAGMMGQFTVA